MENAPFQRLVLFEYDGPADVYTYCIQYIYTYMYATHALHTRLAFVIIGVQIYGTEYVTIYQDL